jgi:hypothetical protein
MKNFWIDDGMEIKSSSFILSFTHSLQQSSKLRDIVIKSDRLKHDRIANNIYTESKEYIKKKRSLIFVNTLIASFYNIISFFLWENVVNRIIDALTHSESQHELNLKSSLLNEIYER